MNKYVLVTSSTKGIGKAIGKKYLEAGNYVFFNYFNNDSAIELLKEELLQYEGNYSIIKADLTQLNSIDIIDSKIDELDYIILNTGITDRSSFKDVKFENWNNVINTNLSIPFFLIQKLSNKINNDGRIIFIGSILGLLPHALSISYAVSKAGLHMLAKSLVKVFKSRNITVNTIVPGFIDTDWHNSKSKEQCENIKNKIALKRFGTTEEVAKLCIAITNNKYINGSLINIDGGYDME